MRENRPDPCRYCNDFSSDPPEERLPLSEWIEGIIESTCKLCHILVQAIRALDPKLLDDKPSDKFVYVYFHSFVRKTISVSVSSTRTKGTSSNRLMIELYTDKGRHSSHSEEHCVQFCFSLASLLRVVFGSTYLTSQPINSCVARNPFRSVVRWTSSRHSLASRRSEHVEVPEEIFPNLQREPQRLFRASKCQLVSRSIASYNRLVR